MRTITKKLGALDVLRRQANAEMEAAGEHQVYDMALQHAMANARWSELTPDDQAEYHELAELSVDIAARNWRMKQARGQQQAQEPVRVSRWG